MNTLSPVDTTSYIDGFDELYQLSRNGNVWSSRTKKFLKHTANGNGYMYVTLFNSGKRSMFRIHVLVAKAFLPNPDKLRFINHIDGNKANNTVENLEWCTRSHNMRHYYHSLWEDGTPTSVRWNKQYEKYQAFIRRGGKELYLGMFSTEKDAVNAIFAVKKVLKKP